MFAPPSHQLTNKLHVELMIAVSNRGLVHHCDHLFCLGLRDRPIRPFPDIGVHINSHQAESDQASYISAADQHPWALSWIAVSRILAIWVQGSSKGVSVPKIIFSGPKSIPQFPESSCGFWSWLFRDKGSRSAVLP